MTQQGFERALQQLTPRRREVLELFLAGNTDEAIAKSLVIAEPTVRQHIRKICQDFGLKNGCDDDRTSQRANLIALFAQYKPDLLHKPTVTESQNPASSTIAAPNTSTSRKQDTCTTEYDPDFVGRDDAITALDNLINKGAKIIQIIAPGGTGKTRLAEKYLEKKFKTVLEFPIAKERKDIASIENLLEFNLRKLGEEPGKELIESLQRLKQKLQNQEIGILIDNLEPALDASGKFIEQHRSYVELLRILTDSSIKSITFITSRERLCEGLDITLYKLPSLNLEAWSEYWHHQEINPDTPILTEIHKIYGGNALAMKVLCNPITNDFNGDIVAYWQENKTEENLEIETAVANLIKEQFERLANINLDAYNLLCRMGCYRYQDEYVSTVPEQGLFCLLWDVAKNQHKRIIRILKDRALVEFNSDEYWLHPVIRKEAIERLRNSDDWEKANIQAGEFWTESVKEVNTVEDALTAFEAYYHYIEIQDFDSAIGVILKRREYRFESDGEYLAYAFLRFGLFKNVIPIIQSSINISDNSVYLVDLYNVLGDHLWLSGELHNAVECHTNTNKIINDNAENIYNNKIDSIGVLILGKRLLSSLLNRGLCYLSLGDINKAHYFFLEVIRFADQLIIERCEIQRYLFNASFCLALTYSINSNKEQTLLYLDTLWYLDKLTTEQEIIIYDSWNKGFSFVFIAKSYKNIGYINESFIQYNKAIIYAEESLFTQVKGIALTGLAELYRIQNEIETALSHHQQSIKILEKIVAKCDLAEAYFQLALTYQKIGDKASSEEYFNKALYLWSPEQIDAPKQIERVLKAMNS